MAAEVDFPENMAGDERMAHFVVDLGMRCAPNCD